MAWSIGTARMTPQGDTDGCEPMVDGTKQIESIGERVFVSRAPMPVDLRLWEWVDRQIVTPRRTVRLVQWGYSFPRLWYAMAREFLAVQLSRKIGDRSYDERQDICDGCEHRKHVTELDSRWAFRRGDFCAASRGPNYPLSRLARLNRKSRHRCAMAKHPGTYPSYCCGGCGGRSSGNT